MTMRDCLHDGTAPAATLSPTDVALRVQGVLARTLGVEADQVRPETELEALGMDSLKTIETNVALEEELGFVTPEVARPDELGLRTVNDLVDHVSRMLQGSVR
jgi:acyl carrier protein